MRKLEILEEKWFKYRRIFCVEGFIDIWSGSETDDPNDEIPSEDESLILTTYYRLNGEGEWLNRSKFDDMMYWLSAQGHLTSSNLVWEQAIKIQTK